MLRDDDVAALGWGDVLAALEGAFRAPGRYTMVDRVMLPAAAGGAYLTMPCSDADGWFGVKQVSVLPANPSRGLPSVQAWYTLFGPDGRPALGCEAGVLTKLRTAAVSALAARELASPEARSLLMIGTGALAPWMIRAHLQVRPYTSVRVWGRDGARAAALVAALRDELAELPSRPALHVADDLESAVRRSDVVSVATTARTPLVRGAWLGPRHHVDLVGAFSVGMRESDLAAVRACDVVVDQHAAARHEAGDLIAAAEEGWSWDQVVGDLQQVLAAQVRRRAGRPTLFKSVGLAYEDLAVARLLATPDAVG